jgi:protein-S-isoprenylcysteine O-methyltransferase Ste14
MDRISDPLYWPVFWTVILCWFGFAVGFLLRKRPQKVIQHARNTISLAGVVLMGVGMTLVWFVRRPVGTSLISQASSLIYVIDIFAVACAMGSVWLVLAAVRTLGKQWNVQAVLVDGHQLVTTGPYHIVRHPIYLGMIGLMISTGIATSRWVVLLIATAFAVAGALLRIRVEDQLLSSIFGKEHQDYRNRVPALLPWIH